MHRIWELQFDGHLMVQTTGNALTCQVPHFNAGLPFWIIASGKVCRSFEVS